MASMHCHGLGDASEPRVATPGARSRSRRRGRQRTGHAREDGGRSWPRCAATASGTRQNPASPHRAHDRGLDGVGAREQGMREDHGGRRTVMASVRCHGGCGDARTRRATASPRRAHSRGPDGVGARASGAGETTTTAEVTTTTRAGHARGSAARASAGTSAENATTTTAEVTTTTRAGHAQGSAEAGAENTTTTTAEVTTTTRTRARGTGCKNEREDLAATGKVNGSPALLLKEPGSTGRDVYPLDDGGGAVTERRASGRVYAASNRRWRRSATLARPYIWRLSIFSFVTWPSVCPLLHG
jgi:hypothetical protein